MCKSKGWARSNNVVGNVTTNVMADTYRPGVSLPFWDGGNKPFSDDKNIINFANGLMDIEQQGAIIPHTPKWVSTYCLPFAYDPTAVCPQWIEFLSQVFPEGNDRVELLQEFFVYCLTQDTSLQKALVLVGKPRSGKGTIQRILAGLAGEQNHTGYSLDSLAKDFGMSVLVGKSIALVGEVELSNNPQRAKITEVLKGLIGEHQQAINKKHEPEMPSVRLKTRFVIATNTIPRLMDSSGALAYRLLFIPFLESFVGREDASLEKKLLIELPGIANWALAGLARLRANNGRFTTGEYHKTSAGQYRDTTSPLLGWLTECCQVSSWANSGDLPECCLSKEIGLTVLKLEAFKSYEAWCLDKGLDSRPFTWWTKDLQTLLPKMKDFRVQIEGRKVGCFGSTHYLGGWLESTGMLVSTGGCV